jgi:putative transposase
VLPGGGGLWHALAMAYWTGGHTKHRLKYHLVWVPKYRKRVLRGKVAARLKRLLYQAAEVNGWAIEELSIQVDHVHLLVQVGPDRSVAHIVQILKGGTSRILRKEFPELEEFLWGDSFWADGYFAETVGRVEEEVIQRYIRNQ